MQILVMSDTHNDKKTVRMLLDLYKDKVKTVVHLGDFCWDLLSFKSEYPELNLVAVAGNGDYNYQGDEERILTLGTAVKRRVMLNHGHFLRVNTGLDRLMYYALEKGVDACLFGHTHQPFVYRHEPVFSCDGEVISQACFFMNPGSPSEPRGGSRAGYGLLSIDDEGNISGEIIEL